VEICSTATILKERIMHNLDIYIEVIVLAILAIIGVYNFAIWREKQEFLFRKRNNLPIGSYDSHLGMYEADYDENTGTWKK
jgi:hypothetical protein